MDIDYKILKTMKKLIMSAATAVLFSAVSCSAVTGHDSTPVSQLDLQRYLGTWYEIARYDHKFERGMDDVTAEYSVTDDGKILVINSGWKDGVRKVAEGKAKCPDPVGNPAHLRVSFFLFFYADYNILYIDPGYTHVLIGSKSDKYLWIMSRTPTLDESARNSILEEAARRGYDTSKLIWVNHDRSSVK